jgi:hypothetical protein
MTQEEDRLARSVARAFQFTGPGADGSINVLQRQLAVEADLGEELECLERASLVRAFEEVVASCHGPRAGAEGASLSGHVGLHRLTVRHAMKLAAKDAKRPNGSRSRAGQAKAARRTAAEASRTAFAPP